MLQFLAEETRYCAVVVESSFSTAREMSYERISGPLHLGSWFGRTLGQPIIASAVLYARIRYHIDLLKPSPLDALEHSTIPVLLIHGMQDRNIEPRHSIALAQAAPTHVQLWLVPNAYHTGAWAAAPREFEAIMLEWFSEHHKAWQASDDWQSHPHPGSLEMRLEAKEMATHKSQPLALGRSNFCFMDCS